MLHDRIEERRNALIHWSAALCLMLEEEEQRQGMLELTTYFTLAQIAAVMVPGEQR